MFSVLEKKNYLETELSCVSNDSLNQNSLALKIREVYYLVYTLAQSGIFSYKK